jgi:hypothetical protein
VQIYIHTYTYTRERGGGGKTRRRRRRRTTTTTTMAAARRGGGGRGGDSERTKTETIAIKRSKKSINGGSDPALPGHAPDQDPPADPAPTVPNPNPRRRSTVARPRACNPTRRGGAGRGVAPRKQGSEAGCRSGTGPAPTASPFLIAAVFPPRAAGIGVVITGRREWEQAAVMADWWHAGMVQDCTSSHRAHASPPPPPHAVASHLN